MTRQSLRCVPVHRILSYVVKISRSNVPLYKSPGICFQFREYWVTIQTQRLIFLFLHLFIFTDSTSSLPDGVKCLWIFKKFLSVPGFSRSLWRGDSSVVQKPAKMIPAGEYKRYCDPGYWKTLYCRFIRITVIKYNFKMKEFHSVHPLVYPSTLHFFAGKKAPKHYNKQ